MKIQIASDLHIDRNGTWNDSQTFLISIPKNSNEIVLIIAGDLSPDVNDNLSILNFYSRFYKNVIFILGNHEYDFARHRCAQHRAYEYAGRESGGYSAQRPARCDSGQSPVWRQGTPGSPAELSHQDRGNGLSLLAALYQAAEARRSRRCCHQEHLSFQFR